MKNKFGFSKPKIQQPSVMLLVGKPGMNKSALARAMVDSQKGRAILMQPDVDAQTLPIETVDWSLCDCLIIDSYARWDKSSLAAIVPNLEMSAMAAKKRILLILEDIGELAASGVKLQSEPGVLLMNGNGKPPAFSYYGKEVAFAAGQAA